MCSVELSWSLTCRGVSSAEVTSDSALLRVSLMLQQAGLLTVSGSKEVGANRKASMDHGLTTTFSALSGPR